MFGLSYLPTAQRLSFSIIKAFNLRFEYVVSDLESFGKFTALEACIQFVIPEQMLSYGLE